jgi:peptidoglycan/xylan/chitin deacetylase (PgdA/CDA1 family)
VAKKALPKILFTVDFDADIDSDEHPFAGWRWMVENAFDRRNDFRAVVNFVGSGLERIIAYDGIYQHLKKSVAAGKILIGNHTWDHPSFTGEYTSTPPLSRAEQADQLLTAHEFITEHLGTPIFFRAPFFNHDHNTLQLIAQLGIRYDLSNYITEAEFKPVRPYEYYLPTNEILVRIDTNLKLSPLEWVEPIMSWSGGRLKTDGLYNIIVHPREFSEPEQADEMRKRLKRLIDKKVQFIGPGEIDDMLEEEF